MQMWCVSTSFETEEQLRANFQLLNVLLRIHFKEFLSVLTVSY
jgi:hypothetical protein